jgi:hypothetical protein
MRGQHLFALIQLFTGGFFAQADERVNPAEVQTVVGEGAGVNQHVYQGGLGLNQLGFH